MANRFGTVGEEEIRNLLKNKNAANTHRATNVAYHVFQSYLEEKGFVVDLELVYLDTLDKILRMFYAEVRRKDGQLYSLNSFRGIRAGIQRKIKETLPEVDIIADKSFNQSNEVFKAQCVRLKQEGLGKVEHKHPILPEDLKKLYESPILNSESPKSLQRKVFFDLMLYTCRRGQENLRLLTKSSYQVHTGSDGRRFVMKADDEMTKNHRVGDENEEGGVMLETGGERCPVSTFLLYVSKLNPDLPALFQRPRLSNYDSGRWYDAQVVGVNSLASMMKSMSVDAGLSQIYTNHCIRATSITILDNCGMEARHIMTVSGHRSESSIRSYARTGAGVKRKMSDELTKFCQQQEQDTDTGARADVVPTKRPSNEVQPPTPSESPNPFPSFASIFEQFSPFQQQNQQVQQSLNQQVQQPIIYMYNCNVSMGGAPLPPAPASTVPPSSTSTLTSSTTNIN